MKKLLLLPLLILIPMLSNAQEKYFHDLKGMEDSEGVTQLFYRIYEEFDLGTAHCGIEWRDDILHLNTSTMTDSTFYPSFDHVITCSPYDISYQNTPDFIFMDGNMSKWIKIDAYQNASLIGSSNAYTYNGSFFDGYARDLGLGKNDTLKFVMMNLEYKNSASIVLHNDSLPSIMYPYDRLVKVASNDEETCTEVGSACYFGATDSVIYHDFNFLTVDIRDSSKVFYQRNDSLFFSDYRADTLHFLNDTQKWSVANSFAFIGQQEAFLAVIDSSVVYSGTNSRTIFSYPNPVFIASEFDENIVFIASGKSVYRWDEINWDSFTEETVPESVFLETEYEITGLYKKPNSEILYVLTTDALLIVENGKAKSLKTLPVSNEPEPTSLPNDITLFQNYPNPFNPSTVISFQLPVSSSVKLDVFDILGRKIATLIDGKTSAGLQEVTFNAQGLSSGMYFYRLETNGFTLTKRLTIIK